MSRKHFSWLLLATFIVAMLVLILPSRTGQESGFEKSLLLPALEQEVNELSWMRVTTGGGESLTTLEQTGDRWIVSEMADYPADWEKLRSLLSDLALAEVVEPKTANPQYYDRLGVEDISSEGAAGMLVEFAQDSGLPAIIVGNAAQGREGQYVRLQGQAESALIDRRLELPRQPSEWLNEDIVDISDAEVVEYEIVHPDGERILASKVSADDENYSLQNVPEGRDIKSDYAVNAPANSLAGLTLDAVVPDSQLAWEDPLRFRLLTADGLQVELELHVVAGADAEGTADDEHWIRLQAGIYTTGVDSAVEVTEDSTEPLERAAEINSRVQGWAYRIPKYKFDSMSKRMADMLQAEES